MQGKFVVKLAAVERTQEHRPHADVTVKTESQSPLKQDSMQGWKHGDSREAGEDTIGEKQKQKLCLTRSLDAQDSTSSVGKHSMPDTYSFTKERG